MVQPAQYLDYTMNMGCKAAVLLVHSTFRFRCIVTNEQYSTVSLGHSDIIQLYRVPHQA